MSDAHMKVLMLALRMARCNVDSSEALVTLDKLVCTLSTEFAYIDADFDEDVFYNCVVRGSNVDGTDYVW